MRPYQILGNRYRVPQRSAATVTRPSRLAAGMAYTASRSSHWHNTPAVPDALILSVHGTLDRVSCRGLIQHSICPCCNAKTGKLQLNDRGRTRLRRVRRMHLKG